MCDESHVLRDPKGTVSRAIMVVPAKHIILMTATPTLSRVEDNFGTAVQVWRAAGFHDFVLPPGCDWDYVVDMFYSLNIEHPQVQDVRLPSVEFSTWRQSADEHYSDYDIRQNNKIVTKWMLWYMDGKGPDRGWLLNWREPQGGDLSATVFRVVNAMTMVRTPASAPITLPDGALAYPQDELPPSNIVYSTSSASTPATCGGKSEPSATMAPWENRMKNN